VQTGRVLSKLVLRRAKEESVDSAAVEVAAVTADGADTTLCMADDDFDDGVIRKEEGYDDEADGSATTRTDLPLAREAEKQNKAAVNAVGGLVVVVLAAATDGSVGVTGRAAELVVFCFVTVTDRCKIRGWCAASWAQSLPGWRMNTMLLLLMLLLLLK
jgi:hypothetical protein